MMRKPANLYYKPRTNTDVSSADLADDEIIQTPAQSGYLGSVLVVPGRMALCRFNLFEEIVKSRITAFNVIPAKAGIQLS